MMVHEEFNYPIVGRSIRLTYEEIYVFFLPRSGVRPEVIPSCLPLLWKQEQFLSTNFVCRLIILAAHLLHTGQIRKCNRIDYELYTEHLLLGNVGKSRKKITGVMIFQMQKIRLYFIRNFNLSVFRISICGKIVSFETTNFTIVVISSSSSSSLCRNVFKTIFH